jgi:hypothetical protein
MAKDTETAKPGSSTGTEVEIEAPTDMFGNKVDQQLDRFPEGSAARAGKATLPSGQGGASPHDGISYQDQWPANPEPSETAKAWGEKVDELGQIGAASEAVGDAAKTTSGDKPNKGTETATSKTP